MAIVVARAEWGIPKELLADGWDPRVAHEQVEVEGSDSSDRGVRGPQPCSSGGWRGHQGKTSWSSSAFPCVWLARGPSALGAGARPAPVSPPLPGVRSSCSLPASARCGGTPVSLPRRCRGGLSAALAPSLLAR